jgi:pimeloyl-ACP methyl ester carboxylesterase
MQPAALRSLVGRFDRDVLPLDRDGVRVRLAVGEHLELDCGHVPQMERPRETHDALARFFAAHSSLSAS